MEQVFVNLTSVAILLLLDIDVAGAYDSAHEKCRLPRGGYDPE